MSRVILQPGVPKRFAVSKGKWLIVREATEYVLMQNETSAPMRVEAGDKIFIGDLKEIELVNPHVVDIAVVCQFADRDMSVQPNTEVQISTSVAVSEIRNEVATRELVSLNMDSHDHFTIEPNERRRLVVANATRKELMISNISDIEGEAMIGGQAVSAVNGWPLVGDRKEPGQMILTVGAEVWAFNNGQFPLKLALIEVSQ